MGNCYSADHIDEDHIHTDIHVTCNIEEPQQKYRLGTVSNKLLGGGGGGGGLKHVLLDPNLAFCFRDLHGEILRLFKKLHVNIFQDNT